MSSENNQPTPNSNAPAETAPVTPAVPVTVATIMRSQVHCVTTEMTVREAIEVLLTHGISGAPVVDNGRKAMSVVSQGDLLKLAATVGLDKTIFQCMMKLIKTDKLLTIEKSVPFAVVYKKFLTNPVHRFIVVDNMGRVEGIVSRSSILRMLVKPIEATKAADPAAAAPPAAAKPAA
jgi:IMP dehydrogenase